MANLLSVKSLGCLSVYLEYDDGVEGKIDLTNTISKNCFDDLKDQEEFSKVFYDECTNELCWPGGVRLCVNALHEKLSLLSLMNRLKIDLDNE